MQDRLQATSRACRVLLVEDSRTMRRMLMHALDGDPRLTVVGSAEDATTARSLIRDLSPDVLVLDVELPGQSGLDLLDRVMRLRPMPVVMFSASTQTGSDISIRALAMGAVDCIPKPASGVTPRVLARLADRVHLAASARVVPRARAPRPASDMPGRAVTSPNVGLVLVAASTGGVAAIETVLGGLAPQGPPVVVCQHMPAGFLRSFAVRLDGLLPHRVALATDGAPLLAGHVYLAPGGRAHTGVRTGAAGPVCAEIRAPRRNGHCPSADILFHSAVDMAPRVTAVILTGLGRDGAEGMRALHDAGAFCIGQDADSCVVHGMPRAAAAAGAIDIEAPVSRIASLIDRRPARAAHRVKGA